jgi:hypothetical protein
MALSVTVERTAQLATKGDKGWLRVRQALVTGDSSYPSGGYPLSSLLANPLGLTTVVGIYEIATNGSVPQSLSYDYANGTLRVYAGNAEVAAGTNLSTATWRVLVFGY